MDYYKDLAEMYVGDDVSPDFYGWVFPKYDHVAVGARSLPSFAIHCVLALLFVCTGLRSTESHVSVCRSWHCLLAMARWLRCCSGRTMRGEGAVWHAAAGTGTVINKMGIKQYQQATRDRSKVRQALSSILLVLKPGSTSVDALQQSLLHAAGYLWPVCALSARHAWKL